MRLTDVPAPDTDVARAVTDVARRYLSSARYAHSARVYLWGAARARHTRLTIDAELLYVAAMLHDLPLAQPVEPHRRSSELDGGELAWVFGAGAGWSAVRRNSLARVVSAPGSPTHAADDAPEAQVLIEATIVDLLGTGLDRFPLDFRDDVAASWPRLGLDAQDVACLLVRHHRAHS